MATPPPVLSAKESRLTTPTVDAEIVEDPAAEDVLYNSATDGDDGDDGDGAAPAAPTDEPKEKITAKLKHAKEAMNRLNATELNVMFTWMDANERKMFAAAAKRKTEAAKRRAEWELAKAASVTNEKEQAT